jgi:hypothetical protein
MAEGIRKRNRPKPYEASVYVIAERRQKRKSFRTFAEVKAWRRDFGREIRERPFTASDSPTVAEAGREFVAGMLSGAIRDRNGKNYKPSTVRSYRRALDLGVIPNLGGRKLAEVTTQDVRALVKRLRKEGLSDSTVRNRLDPLRAIYRHAIEEDRLDYNPTAGLRLPSGRRPRTPSASFEDVAALIEAIRPADRALWAVAFYGGLRRGELLFQCKRAMAVVTSTCHMSFSFARRSVSCACFSRMACFSSMAWSVPRFPSKSACKAAQSMAGVLVVMPGRSFTST